MSDIGFGFKPGDIVSALALRSFGVLQAVEGDYFIVFFDNNEFSTINDRHLKKYFGDARVSGRFDEVLPPRLMEKIRTI